MILLVTGSSRAAECVAAIEQKTRQQTVIAPSPAKAVDFLQAHDCDAVVVDESFQQVENGIDSIVTAHAGTAVPIYVNLSLHGADRIAVEVSSGLQRLTRERLASMRAAGSELRNELRGEVTSILLNSELAMRERSLPDSVVEKLRAVHDGAEQMRRKLEGEAAVAAVGPLKPRLVAKHPAAQTDR